MKRANLLLTDRSSSGSKMTTTGHSTPSGSTRTKAAKGLFSHFMFLASLLLIALLTSGKALAQDTYTVTIVGSNLTVEPDGPIAIGTKTFKLVPAAGYKLPATITVVYDADGGGTTLDLNTNLNGANQYKYDLTEEESRGTVTISTATDIAANKVITITADGVELGHVATLEALTYSNDNISSGAPQNVPYFDNSEIPEISLAYDKNLESSAIRMAGTPTSGSNATITSNDGATITDGAAQATVIVTSEDGEVTKDYVVNFKVANDKLSSITVPTITLESRVSSAAEALELLNAAPNNSFDVVTEGQQDDITLPVEWTFTESFNATAEAQNNFTWTIDESELTEKKLDQNEVALTGTVAVTNAAASTDVKLKTLTYSITDGVGGETVTNFNTSDNEATQTYNVTLSADVPKNAEITVVAEANDEKAAIAGTLTGSLSSNTVTITFTVTAEDEGTSRTVNVIFTRTPSAVATLASLKYKIGANGVEKDVPEFIEGGTAYSDISVPYNTTEAITILPVATDEKNGATIEGNTTVTLSGGKASTTLTVTAEDESTTQQVAISFLADKEKITAIAAPEAPVLTSLEDNTAKKVLEKVNAIETVSATLEGGTTVELRVEWAIKSEFVGTHGAKNTYTWTITAGSYEEYDINEQPTTGEMIVTNYIAAVTEDQGAITINAGDPYTQIGSSESKNITVESVIVDASVDKLAFDNVTVSGAVTVNEAVPTITLTDTKVGGKIDLQASVPSIVLSKASVEEIALAGSMTTALTVQPGSRIETITNAGTLTLNDAAGVAPLSLAIDTRAALTNGSLVGAVNNKGTFTDNTASIVTVTGDVNLSITSLPKNQSTYGKEVTLAVVAETTTGEPITYQWQKNIGGSWTNATGTGNNEATLTVGKTGDGAGSFRCKVVSSKSPATTTLYTRTATVTFLTESGPSEPSNPSTPTYTVSLDKVAGATFSKGETTTVDEGDNFSFKITLDKDYDQSKPVVTVDGTAITADADGNYTIKNIQKDIKIIVSGIVKNTATGIEENVADAARAWSVGSTLYIHVPETSDVYVISGTGALQQQLRGVSGDYNMQLRAGFYIVRIGEVSQKVIIR